MKRAIPFILLAAVLAGGFFWFKQRKLAQAPAAVGAEAKPAEEESATPKVTRDTNGNAVIAMSDEVQGNMGIQVTNPPPLQMTPEVKGYGRVLDPAPLTALMAELATAQAAHKASSNELSRLRLLAGQGNASTRALQAAEAAELRDHLAVKSTKDRLALNWGPVVAGESDLPAFVQSLTSLETVLIRIDLPASETLDSPGSARISTLAGKECDADFLSNLPNVDPQMQGRGFLYRAKLNAAGLSPGMSVTAHLKVTGDPLSGVVIPRDAVVRTEGNGWVYVLDSKAAESFTRIEIPLDHPVEMGWFVSKGVKAGDYVVVRGAQQLLSIELTPPGAAGD